MGLYDIEVRHDGLHKYRVISGNDPYIVKQKAAAQKALWDEQWKKKLAQMNKQKAREDAARAKAEMKALAAEETEKAQVTLRRIDETLLHTLRVNDRVDWERLKDDSSFSKPKPEKPKQPKKPREPQETDAEFLPRFGFLDNLLRGRRERRLTEARESFMRAHSDWEAKVRKLEEEFQAQKSEYEKALSEWENDRQLFLEEQAKKNAAIDERRRLYEAKDPGSIVDYCDLVLSNSEYPDFFPQDFQLDYNPANGILIVDYVLPAPSDIPKVKEVRYVQSKDDFVEVTVSEAEANKRYDSLLYQICLRTIHELFEADAVDALRAVVFNGWVHSVDPATGKDVNACVLSVQADKETFTAIDLSRVDPKACFKSLKGVGSSKLHSLAPVPPVMVMDKNDRRFVASYEVAKTLDDTVNLAAIDWEDFEHLIREVFEAEFASNGGEVKVTQASRDGGVDAIAFDPDPIRGGKIVIQAKRYTNTVGVSAVRDLYGTVVNEGATKGILVTTADYGPDAYEFAKGKPLTLLNGGNLLHLLEKHGHKAKIDLNEAKALLAEKAREESQGLSAS